MYIPRIWCALAAFMISAALAGLAGGLFAGFIGFLGPEAANVETTFNMLLYVMVGGIGSLAPGKPPVRTVGSYWPYATTLFDYIRRAMPFQESKSLTSDEVYAVSAYILHLNGIVGANDLLDSQSLPKVKMPNRDGFIPFPRNPR